MGVLGKVLPGVFLLLALGVSGSTADTPWHPQEFTDLEGRRWTAADLEGRVVMLAFWATWCAPCRDEFPHLRHLQERFGEEDFLLVGIVLDTLDRRRLRSFLLRHNITWPQVHENLGFAGELARRFRIEAVPAIVLIDREGRLVARDLRGRALEVTVETLLEKYSGATDDARLR